MFQSEVVNTVFIVILHDQNQLGGDDLSGKVKLKSRAFAHLALYPDLSSMQFDKLLGQG
jgi:hypothetical protein